MKTIAPLQGDYNGQRQSIDPGRVFGTARELRSLLEAAGFAPKDALRILVELFHAGELCVVPGSCPPVYNMKDEDSE